MRVEYLSFTALWVNSADDKMMIVFLFLPENMIQYFMQILSYGDICMKCQILFPIKILENVIWWKFYSEC